MIEAFWPSRRFGGPIDNTFRLCTELAAKGDAIRVLTTTAGLAPDAAIVENRWTAVGNLTVFYATTDIGLFSRRMASELRTAISSADGLHVTGIYNWVLPYVTLLARNSSVPLICAPRGSLMINAKRHHRWRKRCFDAALRGAMDRVDLYHATSLEEANDIRVMYPQSRVEIIPNGVDLPFMPTGSSQDAESAAYMLYVGRLHPYKQVDRIISAFAASRIASTARLVIAGEGTDGYVAYLRGLALQLGVERTVEFVGYVTGAQKAKLISDAVALVLFSRSENFGVVVAEALAAGVPVLVTRDAPWTGVEDNRCGFSVDPSTDALVEAMDRLAALSQSERRAMGQRGRAWMQKDFSWASAASKLAGLFRQLAETRAARYG